MNTTEILLNIDLAAGTSALVMIGMIAVPNTDRIRAFWRVLTRSLRKQEPPPGLGGGSSRARGVPSQAADEGGTTSSARNSRASLFIHLDRNEKRGPPPSVSEAARARGEEVLGNQLQPLVAPQLWHL